MDVNMSGALATARRATVGRSALGGIATLCLAGSGVFWATIFWGMLEPPTPWSPQAVQAGLMSVVYTLVLPLFWSMLAPTTPAGRLLQKTQWATLGYLLVVVGAVFLSWHGGTWLWAWWSAQRHVADAGQALFLTIASLIAGVLVPALSWTVVTPEQWVAQIQQAQAVRRIERQMQLEEATAKALHARALILLQADLADLTLAQHQELGSILATFHIQSQRALGQVAESFKAMHGVELALPLTPEPEIIHGYQQVTALLSDAERAMESVHLPPVPSTTPSSPVSASWPPRPPASAGMATIPLPAAGWTDMDAARPAPDGHISGTSAAPDAARTPLTIARQTLGRSSWKRATLEATLAISRSAAHAYIQEWKRQGLVDDVTGQQHHYQFVEVA